MYFRLAAIVLCLFLVLGGLTCGELYRNEGLRARLAVEVLTGGDWCVPTLYGEPHLTKPPGMALLIALVSLPVGQVTTVTARLPSVLAALVAILLVGWAVGRAHGRRAGWLAAVLLPCTPLWLDRVPSAEIDMVQLAWVTGAMAFFLRAMEEKEVLFWWLATFFCVLGGFFTKWTAPAFFYWTVLPLLVWRREGNLLLTRGHMLGVALFALGVVAWFVGVGYSVGWQLFGETISREALLRFSPAHHPRPYPWDELITFPLTFLAGCLPWVVAALFACRREWGQTLQGRQRTLWQLSLVWLVVSVLVWTVLPGHRPRHLLPAQPAIACLAAPVVLGWLEGRWTWRFHWLSARAVFGGLVLGWAVVKLIWVGVFLPLRFHGKDLRAAGRELARLVPPGEVLHLIQLKDDGLLFYYGRPARRVTDCEAVPLGACCLLTEAEWHRVNKMSRQMTQLQSGQGEPLYLVRRLRLPSP